MRKGLEQILTIAMSNAISWCNKYTCNGILSFPVSSFCLLINIIQDIQVLRTKTIFGIVFVFFSQSGVTVGRTWVRCTNARSEIDFGFRSNSREMRILGQHFTKTCWINTRWEVKSFHKWVDIGLLESSESILVTFTKETNIKTFSIQVWIWNRWRICPPILVWYCGSYVLTQSYLLV